MKASFVVILIIAIGIFGAVNYYIGLRIWQYSASYIKVLNKTIYWIIFWVIASSYILTRNIPDIIPDSIKKLFAEAGGYWMAAMLYFILLFLTLDIIRLFLRVTHLVPKNVRTSPGIVPAMGISILILVFSILIYGTYNARNTVVKYHDIYIDKQAGSLDRLHIVAASDLHLGILVDRERLTEMVDKINAQNPDLVLLPGDILDDDVVVFEKQEMWQVLSKIKATYGVFAALGNHEYIGSETAKAIELLEKSGIQVLKDKAVLVNNSFYVAGRDDNSSSRFTSQQRKPLESVLAGVNKSLPVLLMDHQPVHLEEAEANQIDLQVSGHTHRGQLFPGQLITDMIYELDYGYIKKENTHYMVSSGIGTWGPPLKVGTPSEILDITFRFK